MYSIAIGLLSDATPGRGDGVAGLLDTEIEYEATTGLPFLRGRTIKGLLVESCADLLTSLEGSASTATSDALVQAARDLFGQPGSTEADTAMLHIGSARFPDDLRKAVTEAIATNGLTPEDILTSLTAIRRQSAVDDERGTPADSTLRSTRVLLRGVTLVAPLTFDRPYTDTHRALLAACALSTRRLGTSRNRGRGEVRLSLRGEDDIDLTADGFELFAALITEGAL